MIKRISTSALDKKYLSILPYQAAPIAANLFKLVVNKPWGNEYLMYSNPSIEVWNLFISHNRATSMHCHPNKKTALLVLEGKALFSTLNQSVELTAHDAIMIDPAVFHSTQAISPDGARIFEFETPPLKHDLVRLEDKYGRTNQGYETIAQMIPDEAQHLRLTASGQTCLNNYCQQRIELKNITDPTAGQALSALNNSLAIVLAGAIRSGQANPLFQVADVFDPTVLSKQEKNSNLKFENLEVMLISRL